MTIGVVDECRRLGLGSRLLDYTIDVLNKQWPNCEVLYLHVVDYNDTALKFYLNQKNKFIQHSIIKDHYVIHNKNYDAVLLYRDISRGFNED